MSVSPDVLASFPMFEHCGPAELERLAERLQHRALDAGEVVMREGDAASEFALVLSGEVSIRRGHGAAVELLAVAPPGAIVGELALLRDGERTATVVTTRASEFGVGDHSDLDFLLQLPGVHDNIRDLASARLAQDVRSVRTTVAGATEVLVRPLLPSDRAGYTAAIGQLSPASLRRRFFSEAPPSERLVDYLLHVDYVDHFVWLVLLDDDPQSGVATGRYIRSKDSSEEAEIAFAVVDAYQGRGLGQLLVGAVAVAAHAAGITRLNAEVLEDNAPMRGLLGKAGAHFAFHEPGVVRAELATSAAADLLDPTLRTALDQAAHDVVTAAGLALT